MKKLKAFLAEIIVKVGIILFTPVYGNIWEPYSPEASGIFYSAILKYSISAGLSINELFPIVFPLALLFSIPGIYYEYKLLSIVNKKTLWGLTVAFTIIILAGPYSMYFLFVPDTPLYHLIGPNFGLFSILMPAICALIAGIFVLHPILEYQINSAMRLSGTVSGSEELGMVMKKGKIASVLVWLAIFVSPFEIIIFQSSFWTTGFIWNISSYSGYELVIRYSVNLFAFSMAFSGLSFPFCFWFLKKVLDYFKGTCSIVSALKIGVLAMLSVYISMILFILTRGFFYLYLPIPMPVQLLLGYAAMHIGKDVQKFTVDERERVWTDES